MRIALRRPEQIDAVRAAAQDQEVGIDVAGIDQGLTREQVAVCESPVDARHGVEVEHRGGGGLDVRDQVRRVRLARPAQAGAVRPGSSCYVISSPARTPTTGRCDPHPTGCGPGERRGATVLSSLADAAPADRPEDAMPDRTPEAPCPPHHWEVTSRRRDGETVEHHRCLRCGAETEIPFAVAAGRTRQITLRGPTNPAGTSPKAPVDRPETASVR
ncbi:MAG TPA: hypothetical protein VGJ53_08645 [Micromonosporaceae bacterium]